MCEEAEIAVAALKKETSVGDDNIPAELVRAGGKTITDVLSLRSVIRSEKQENGLPHGFNH